MKAASSLILWIKDRHSKDDMELDNLDDDMHMPLQILSKPSYQDKGSSPPTKKQCMADTSLWHESHRRSSEHQTKKKKKSSWLEDFGFVLYTPKLNLEQ